MSDSNPKIEQAPDEVLRNGDLNRHFHYRRPSDTAVPVHEVREHLYARLRKSAGGHAAVANRYGLPRHMDRLAALKATE